MKVKVKVTLQTFACHLLDVLPVVHANFAGDNLSYLDPWRHYKFDTLVECFQYHLNHSGT